MKLKGKDNVEKIDVMMYQGLYALANNQIQKVDEELIPTFIIEEALSYFCELEKFEICQSIKSFFLQHPTYTVQSSREDWYGIPSKKAQKH
jgi:hypothetical protein